MCLNILDQRMWQGWPILSKVKRVLISHLYPHSEPVPVEVIKKHYPGEVILAEDLLVIEV
jgi:ribonuclease BN (tRNA processing enzyme)